MDARIKSGHDERERRGETSPDRLRRAEFPCIVKPNSGLPTGTMGAMEKLTMDNVVGFVLAILFALVMGISMWGLLVGDYVNTAMNEQTRHTLRIVGFAGALAALATWWVQNFAARRGFTIRFLFAMMIFAVAFGAFGGLLRFIYIHATYPSQQDWSLTGLYFASLNDFYTFLLDMFLPPRPAYAALTVAAAIFVAIFGPREAKTVDI
jgi:fluoride ion exporter CrcB/FEX